jgi:uncharacterized membrane protein YqjE
MASHEPSIADVIKSALRDAQDLVRGEIALAKAEAREELGRISTGAALLAGAAAAAVLGLVFLLATIAWAISEVLAWPVWAGFGIVTVLALILAGILTYMGKSRLTAARHMSRTIDTLKENMEWMRARTP